jgi:hypothetical protein
MPETRGGGTSGGTPKNTVGKFSEIELIAALASINIQLVTLTTDQKNIAKNLEDKVENLQVAMDHKIDKLRADICEELSGTIQENTTKIEANSKKLTDLERKYEELENSLELSEKSVDIIVRGIPMLKDENLETYYKNIAVAIKFDPEILPRVRAFRLGRKKPGSRTDPPILFKFSNRFDRMDFFRAYLKDINLKLSDIGLTTDTRIYLSDNMTTMNRRIFQAAWKLRDEKKIFSVKTISGKVYIRIREADMPIAISHLSELPSSS